MPVSVVSCSGPASVKTSTSASAAWPLAFIRYSWIRAAVRCPGPTNQKSVPGDPQAAVGRLPVVVCSTSSPCAIAPLAWRTTPPRICVAAIELALACCVPDMGAAVRSVVTVADRGLPGCVTSSRGAVVAPDSRLSTADPGVARPVPGGAAIRAIPVPAAEAAPGAGQTRVTAVTATDRGGRGTVPAPSVTICPRPASPYRPARTRPTATPAAIRLALSSLTSRPLRARQRARHAMGQARPAGPVVTEVRVARIRVVREVLVVAGERLRTWIQAAPGNGSAAG